MTPTRGHARRRPRARPLPTASGRRRPLRFGGASRWSFHRQVEPTTTRGAFMSTTITTRGITTAEVDDLDDEPTSGVSWPAIFAGAAAAAALSLILVVLGIGLGFSVASPWALTRDS